MYAHAKKGNGTDFDLGDVLSASFAQGIVDKITDTSDHIPSNGEPAWRYIKVISDSVFETLLQSNFYVNGVQQPDRAISLGTLAAEGTLTLSGVATDAETVTINTTEVYEFAADEDVTVTEGNIAVDITPYITGPFGTLTLSGVAKDAEAITIGSEVYEFAADAAQTVTEGRTPINIAAVTTKASGTLTVVDNPTAGNTMTIGSTVYTFRATADFDAAGEIEIGDAAADTQANIIAAIMGTDGVNTAHTLVTIGAFNASNQATVTAKTGGTVGNTIATTETFTSESNVFGAAALASGADCLAPAAVTAIVAAINANSEIVTAVDGAGDTVVATAIEKFPESPIASTETMANGAWGATTLAADTTCAAADAVTALVAAINANNDSAVTAVDGDGNTVVVTAKTKGASGNEVGTTETMSNGAWGAEVLEDGANGTVTAGTELYGIFTNLTLVSGDVEAAA